MSAPARIVLVGFMGSGKSSVGEVVARRLGWRFVDMDGELEARLGLSVAEIFRQHGEERFRAEEGRLAGVLEAETECVVAAGGGAFAPPGTRRSLSARAVTIWLRCDVETVLARLPLDGSRPLAVNRERILKLFLEREATYRLADHAVDARQTVDETADAVLQLIPLRGRKEE